jgi:hypothetical protein
MDIQGGGWGWGKITSLFDKLQIRMCARAKAAFMFLFLRVQETPPPSRSCSRGSLSSSPPCSGGRPSSTGTPVSICSLMLRNAAAGGLSLDLQRTMLFLATLAFSPWAKFFPHVLF